MSVFPQCYSIIIDPGISAPRHGKEVLNGINDINNRYKYQIMSNVKLPRSKIFETQIIMHSCTQKKDVSLDKQFQKNLSKEYCKHGVIYQC